MTTSNDSILIDPNYPYLVSVPWEADWNTVAMGAIEMFGLAGSKYVCEAHNCCLVWLFKDSKDALMFRLKFSEAVW